MNARRTILLVVGLLAAGVATTVATAWVAGWRALSMSTWDQARIDPGVVPSHIGNVSLSSAVAVLRSRYEARIDWYSRRDSDSAVLPEQAVAAGERAAVLPWVFGVEPWPEFDPSWRDPTRAHQNVFREVDTFGWPRRALWCRFDWVSTDQGLKLRPFGGLALSSDAVGITFDPLDRHARVLPYTPLWGGLVLDSLIFAVAWAVLGVLSYRLFSLSQRRRLKRTGCCTRCGFDLTGLQGSICPECGSGATSAP